LQLGRFVFKAEFEKEKRSNETENAADCY